LTVKVCPPITIVPERAAPVAFASTVYCTTPFPDPDAPEVTTIHETELTAVQLHAALVATVTDPLPTDIPIVRSRGVSTIVHPESCVTVTACPPTETVPLRAGPVFAATERSTEPLPVPLAPAVTVIHAAFDTAVHAQLADVMTSTRARAPPAGDEIVSGVTVIAHPLSWAIVNVWPAMMAVPLRGAPAFTSMERRTVSLPLPIAPATTAIQGTLLVAVHVHPPGALTVTSTVPPAAGTFCCVGLMVELQLSAWLTVNAFPAIVSVPERAGPVFAAAAKVTDPLPEPLPPDVIVSQGALLAAVQPHPLGAATLTLLLPPADGAA
jgi:hypothetical protein